MYIETTWISNSERMLARSFVAMKIVNEDLQRWGESGGGVEYFAYVLLRGTRP